MEYTIRRSSRARHVWLRFSPAGDLVVVLPVGYDARRVPSLLKERYEWVEKTEARLRQRRAEAEARQPTSIPESIQFAATGEEWIVRWCSCPERRTTVRETSDGVLEVVGNTDDMSACRDALRRWLVRAVRRRLEPWLRELGDGLGFRVGRVSIRSQRTRWASCSRRGDISLNVRLLFVKSELARHVLLHELCHTRQMNHSDKFWALLTSHDSECLRHRRELRDAWGLVPAWLSDGPANGPMTVD